MSVEFKFRRGHVQYIGVYKITSPSGKVYVGQSWDILERWRSYKSSYPMRGQPKLANSLRKYGPANHKFEIAMWFSAGCDQRALDTGECELMASIRSAGVELLNIKEGGKGGRPAPETSIKMVATRRANGSYPVKKIRRPPTAEEIEATRQRRQRIWLGRKHSEETKQKIGAANQNSRRPDLAEYNRLHKSSQMRGSKHSEETKRKMSLAHKGKTWSKGRIQSDAERQKRSEITRRWWANKKAAEGAA